MRSEHSIEIAAPPETVFAVVADVERWPEITASITSVRLLDGGTLDEGSRVRIAQPRLLPATWRVTRYDPPRGFWWETSMPGVRILAGHRVEPTPGGSRLILELEATGPLAGLMAMLTSKMTARYVAMEAAGVKTRAESLASA